MISNPSKNVKPSRPKTSTSSTYPDHHDLSNTLEKTTEGILKAARLGDLKMLSELHREGIIFCKHFFKYLWKYCPSLRSNK